MASSTPDLLDIRVHRNQPEGIPAHHVTTAAASDWTGYLTNWMYPESDTRLKNSNSRASSRDRGSKSSKNRSSSSSISSSKRIAFENPWPSWRKPTRQQVWDALEWGEDQDPCIQLAASHADNVDEAAVVPRKGSNTPSKSTKLNRTRAQIAGQLLTVQQPDFSFDPASQQAKTTWLGHAGMLVQLRPLSSGGRPIRCIFDPIFSNRSSPSQSAGPIRSYPPPCKIESLPPIDIFMLSHNHHDHLDYDTVMSLWKFNKESIRFIVPLGNKAWFLECGINEDRVTELDWWESVELSCNNSTPLRITCTPNQHNSGRTGSDANETLWSSWFLQCPDSDPYRVYFAGDTGYQFHDSKDWPPEPSVIDGKVDVSKKEYQEKVNFPSCPAFQEIAERLGSPDLLLLPIAVGATFSYLRSCIPLSDALSPFPRHKPGMTGANHMPPWDAVHVLNLMTAGWEQSDRQRPVAVAIHWGTFVPERSEVLKTLGQLEYACTQQNVQFGRSIQDISDESNHPAFLVLNHGQSVIT